MLLLFYHHICGKITCRLLGWLFYGIFGGFQGKSGIPTLTNRTFWIPSNYKWHLLSPIYPPAENATAVLWGWLRVFQSQRNLGPAGLDLRSVGHLRTRALSTSLPLEPGIICTPGGFGSKSDWPLCSRYHLVIRACNDHGLSLGTFISLAGALALAKHQIDRCMREADELVHSFGILLWSG